MAKGKAKANTCPECGGRARGRGYVHAAGCKAIPPTSRAARRGAGYHSGMLKTLDVDQLLAVIEDAKGHIRERGKAALVALKGKAKRLEAALKEVGK